MATDKVDETRKFAGASHQLSYSKEARVLVVDQMAFFMFQET
jgi:hypothetical protein